MEERVFNTAMLRLISRADLENHMISRAILAVLLRCDFMTFGALHADIEGRFGMKITEKTLRKHIEFTNDKLRMINNLDMKQEITLAHIYDITVEVGGEFHTRIALVHNVH